MYRCVATTMDDGTVVMEMITPTGSMLPKVVYESIDALPQDIGDKIKQLKWIDMNDQGFHENIGTRVGPSIYWIC